MLKRESGWRCGTVTDKSECFWRVDIGLEVSNSISLSKIGRDCGASDGRSALVALLTRPRQGHSSPGRVYCPLIPLSKLATTTYTARL